PVISAVVRVLEVALGGAVAAAVSMLVFPERAHKLGIQAASRLLRDMAGLLPAVLSAFTQSADLNGIRRRQNDLGRAVGAFDELAAEARRERMVFFTRDVDPAPLSRTLLRLQHDFVILNPVSPSIIAKLASSSCGIFSPGSVCLMRAAMIRPKKIAGAAETGNMNCQSSLALRVVHTTLTRKAISKELREANAKIAVTTSIVVERIASTLFGQNSSRNC
ncbi:MAG TPA: hypothetical protein VFE60_26495, partial [Roseiarcus sp.]|nr:hypothetical protein [Roseiarcus sp.]